MRAPPRMQKEHTTTLSDGYTKLDKLTGSAPHDRRQLWLPRCLRLRQAWEVAEVIMVKDVRKKCFKLLLMRINPATISTTLQSRTPSRVLQMHWVAWGAPK